MTLNKKEIANRIKSIRLTLGLTMEEFGKKLDTSKGAVNNWEKEKSLPNNERLKRIAELGNISVNELLYGSAREYAYKILIEELEKDGAFLNKLKQYLFEQGLISSFSDKEAYDKAIQQINISFKEIFLQFLLLKANSPDSSTSDIYIYPNTIIQIASDYFSINSKDKDFLEYYEHITKILERIETKKSVGGIEDIKLRLQKQGLDEEKARKEAIDKFYYTKVAFMLSDFKDELENIYNEYMIEIKK